MVLDLNKERVARAVAWFVTAFGAGLAGYFAAWGFGSKEQWLELLTNPNIQAMAVTAIVSLVPLIQRWLSGTEKKIVATTEQLPNVQKVLTQPTEAGQALAAAVPSPNVVSAADVVVTEIPPPPVKDK